MPEIVLTTFNARYTHPSLGLRSLAANLGTLRDRAEIVEFDLNCRPVEALEAILRRQPRIVGIGVYIWNLSLVTDLVAGLKALRPDIVVVVGGPEVSFPEEWPAVALRVDHVLPGEAEISFRELCTVLLSGAPPEKSLGDCARPDLAGLELPYELYTEEDLAHRVLYVEASRGCPFACDFCLSSVDRLVRAIPLKRLLPALERLLDRGALQFKFVDRTFNGRVSEARTLLEFFLDRYRPGLFVHVEMVPDALPDRLKEVLVRFPPGSLQIELGIQTLNREVARRVGRSFDQSRIVETVRFLRERTSVHVHADLIVGLPGEDLQSFGAGFDRLVSLGPQEVQVGILKRLRGTSLGLHSAEWDMVFNPCPPYEILRTKSLDFSTLARLKRFSRIHDLVVNRGRFRTAGPLLWRGRSPFESFWAFSDWIYDRLGRTHSIASRILAESLRDYLVGVVSLDPVDVANALEHDLQSERTIGQRPEDPRNLSARDGIPRATLRSSGRRQARHLG